MKDYLERESKWEVEQDFVLPELGDIVPNALVEGTSVELTTTYYDTVDLDLLASDVVLRRREGADESGWQVKIPHARGRLELSMPLSGEVPEEIAELVKGVGLGKEVAPVAVIRTGRERHRVFDGDRELVLEVDDDTVRASSVARAEDAITWHEVEVELGRATDELPRALEDAFVAAGAQPSRYPSKLARVLPRRGGWQGSGRAAERAVYDYLSEQIDRILGGDVELRRGTDPIHDTRVASRRLRSTLRVFAPLFDRAAIEPVEEELKWYAAELGEVRDCDVQRRRLADRIAALPPELVLGPVAAHIEADLHGTRLRRRAELAEVLDSPRYLRLLATLSAWRTAPPFDGRIRARDLVRRARRAAKKADKRLRTALRDEQPASLHRARKAAKRARYAAELHRPVGKSGRAKANIAHYKAIQRVLGDYNDGMVSARYLWRTATVAGTAPGENGFTYGLLYAGQLHEADAARARIAEVARS